jgi:tRNA-splicing ligase RtcB
LQGREREIQLERREPFALRARRTLISTGLDEVPIAYKNICEVMAAQNDFVTVLGQFDPKLVKMAPSGERPEDRAR